MTSAFHQNTKPPQDHSVWVQVQPSTWVQASHCTYPVSPRGPCTPLLRPHHTLELWCRRREQSVPRTQKGGIWVILPPSFLVPHFPDCSFLSLPAWSPGTPTEKQTLDHTLVNPTECSNTAAPFTQANLLRFRIQELQYSNLVLPSCYYWASWEASQEQRICSEKNVKKWRLAGPQPQQ